MVLLVINLQIFIGIPIFNPELRLLDGLIGRVLSSQIQITVSFDPCSEFQVKDFKNRYGSHDFINTTVAITSGVWENHLHLLNLCESKYIYFLHQDDRVEFEALFNAFEIWVDKVGMGSLSFAKGAITIRPRDQSDQVHPDFLTSIKMEEKVDFNCIGNRLGPPSMNIYEASVLKSVPFSGRASMDMVWNAWFLKAGMATAWYGASFIKLGNPPNRDGRLATIETGLERLDESDLILSRHIDSWEFATFYRSSIRALFRGAVGKVVYNRALRVSDLKIMLRLMVKYAVSLFR